MKNKLTQEYLKEALHYDPETGIFTWNERPESHFKNYGRYLSWNDRFSNKTIGCFDEGYLKTSIDNKLYRLQRLAWLYMEGYLPEHQVDHMDRNKANNKWENLREVSAICNAQNCNMKKNNKSGVTGVCFVKNLNKWRAAICINHKSKYLGIFDNFDDAVRVRYNEELDNPEWTCSIDSSALKYLQEKGEI